VIVNSYSEFVLLFSDGKRGAGTGGRPPRREPDDKVHDSLIEERLQRERPCRTLFIRNIKVSQAGLHLSAQFIFSLFEIQC